MKINREAENGNGEVLTDFWRMSAEQTIEWKIEKKSLYANPYRQRTHEELQREFPEGRQEKGKFIVDTVAKNGRNIRKVFNERGLEVERLTYTKDSIPGPLATNDSFINCLTSEYDIDGYLIGVIYLKRSGPLPGGYVTTIEYDTENDIRIPSRLTQQEVLLNPKEDILRVPGWPTYKAPRIIDFTDVPYVRQI